MEELFESSVAAGEIPGAVLLAKDRTGKIDYAQAFGARSINEAGEKQPLTLDTVMRFASTTKLITSIACMQCVERGLLDLDADVKTLLPEVANLQILTGFNEDGNSELCERKKPLTLRHMLSQSSGLCYDAMSPLLIQYRAYEGKKVQPGGDKIEDRFLYPLIYEPGDEWTYGPNLEWAGRLVERACGGQSLEEYMQQNICQPLGISDMTFRLQQHPEMIARHADMADRSDGRKFRYVDEAYWHHDPVDAMGGMGIFTSPASYMKILTSLLMDDGKLLKPATVELLFQPQLSASAETLLMKLYEIDEMNEKMGALLPKGVKKNHALGGMLITEDVDGSSWRSRDTLVWSGWPNIYWLIDRRAGLCALYACQVQPPGDEISIELARAFEKAMYTRLRS